MNKLLELNFGDKVRVEEYSITSFRKGRRKLLLTGSYTGFVIRKRWKTDSSKNFRWYSAWNKRTNEIFDFVVGEHPKYPSSVRLIAKAKITYDKLIPSK